jgi:hypothetical protein
MAGTPGHTSARDGYDEEQRDNLQESLYDPPPSFHTTNLDWLPPSQAKPDACRPSGSFDTWETGPEIHHEMVPESESNAHQVIMPRSTVGNQGSPSYHPTPSPKREQSAPHGLLGVGHETYGHDIHVSAQHHQFGGVQSIDKEPCKRTRRSKRSRNKKAKRMHVTSQGSSDPSTSPSHPVLHPPVVSHPAPTPHFSPSSYSCAGSPSPKISPDDIPPPMSNGPYWTVPAQHIMVPAHHQSLLHPVYMAPAYRFARPSAPIPVTQPLSPYIQQLSGSPPFCTHFWCYPNTYADTPIRGTTYDRHPHTDAAATESVHHQTMQTSGRPSSSNLPTFTTPSWREGGPRIGMTSLEADLPLPASPSCSSRCTTRRPSLPEPVIKRARRA